MASGTALWESLVGKPRGKALRESHRSLDPREGKRDTAATAQEEIVSACPHSRQGLTPLGRLQKYPKMHVSTGEEYSGSDTDSTHSFLKDIFSMCKESACNAEDIGDTGSILGSGKSPGEGHGNPLQYSCLGNYMDRGA